MIHRFEIVSRGSPRPDAKQIIFCDGTGGSLFRPETDLELSHWRPNCTPTEYRAGTSTEICFRFLDQPWPGDWTVAVNNHVDVDGILSVFTLVHSTFALAHRKTIIQAAELGDFWGWGDADAQRVFQGVTRLTDNDESGKALYSEAFRRIPHFIDGTDPQVGVIEESLAPLRRGVQSVEQGIIVRKLLADHLAHYIVPQEVAGEDDAVAFYWPEFNELVSEKSRFWPQVRARWDRERACLVSTERQSGWFHDLYFPGYLWADTEGLWRVPELDFQDGMTSYHLSNSEVINAFGELQKQETATGFWGLGGTELPFGVALQSRFPLVGRFFSDQQPGASHLSPEKVAKVLGKALLA